MESFKIDYTKYIVPIFDTATDRFLGSGFLINNMLVTAFHVGSEISNVWGINFLFTGKIYQLLRFSSNKIVQESYNTPNDEEGNHHDLAVFYIEGIKSPLILADKPPILNETYTSICFQPSAEGCFGMSCDCKIIENLVIRGQKCEKWNNYSSVLFSGKIGKGSSGSPILRENVVYGMITDGVSDFFRKKLIAENRENEALCCRVMHASYIQQRLQKASHADKKIPMEDKEV